MDCADLIHPDGILAGFEATSKKQLLQALSAKAEELGAGKAGKIFDTLLAREKLGTTGVGRGVAVPHGKLEDLDRVIGVFAVLESRIDFESVDGQPVDLVFLLMVPKDAGAMHLKALARISRALRDPETCAALRASRSPERVRKIFHDASVEITAAEMGARAAR